ncbi:MAG: hypothetical protein RLZZ237_84 [Pseudomonadota bacterium]
MHVDTLNSLALLLARAQDDGLTFPTSVNAALRLQQALGDADFHVADIHRLLLSEPALSARAVALANSVIFTHGRIEPVSSVRAAIERLGQRNLQSLATAAVIRQIHTGIADDHLRTMAAQLWTHTVHVTAMSHDIARAITKTDADTAMFAAIVHEVGGLYLLAEADRMPGLYQQLDGHMAAALEVITRALMRQLGVPPRLADAIVTLPGTTIMLPPAGLRDTLLLAKLVVGAVSPLPQAPRTVSAELQTYLDTDPVLQALRSTPSAEAQALITVLLG